MHAVCGQVANGANVGCGCKGWVKWGVGGEGEAEERVGGLGERRVRTEPRGGGVRVGGG